MSPTSSQLASTQFRTYKNEYKSNLEKHFPTSDVEEVLKKSRAIRKSSKEIKMEQRINNDMTCDLAQSFTIMPATLGNTQVFDSVTGRASKVPPEMVMESYRSNSGSRYGANSNQIDKQPYSSSYLKEALKSSQLSHRGCRGGERIERVSDLPVEFKS